MVKHPGSHTGAACTSRLYRPLYGKNIFTQDDSNRTRFELHRRVAQACSLCTGGVLFALGYLFFLGSGLVQISVLGVPNLTWWLVHGTVRTSS